MNRATALDLLRKRFPELQAMGVRSIGLFGSVARDEAGPDSDVDVLVEFEGKATFDGYMDVLFALQEWFGCRVDLVTPRSLERKPQWRKRIEAEVVHVA
ncbi:MAG: nucleotidyltransferase family protein [Myxococcota bacterium]